MKLIMPHIGLGDNICLAPLILKIANGEETTIPCYTHNLVSVKSFFVNHPHIKIQEVKNESDVHNFYTKYGCIRMGVYNPSIPPKEDEDYISWIHRQMGFDKIVYDDTLEVAAKELKQIDSNELSIDILGNKFYFHGQPFCFIHDDVGRGYVINKLKEMGADLFIKGTKDDNSILQYAKIINYAKEIHVIDSSFLHLSEALPTTGKLFFHKYARDGGSLSNYKFRKEWTILT